MRKFNNIIDHEFKKCGEIMVAAKRNKLAMTCNFCQQMFEQLPAFMRHLQLQHNDEVEFFKPAKEVEVYAVEELMNQSLASCTSDIQCEDSHLAEDETKWLSEADMKWLDEGEEPKKKKQSKDGDEEEGVSMANISILRALQDCDVSFNLLDDLYSTKCIEDEQQKSDVPSALLREIHNEWEDSDTNGSIPNSIDCNDTEMINFSKHVMDMEDIDISNTCIQENRNATTKENVDILPTNCIKSLLEGLEDFDDVDCLLKNLEGNLTTRKSTKNQIDTKVLNKEYKYNNYTKAHNLQIGNHSNNSKVLLNTKLAQKFNQEKSENLVERKVLLNMSLDIQSEKLEEFETLLREVEDELAEDITDSNKIAIKNQKYELIPEYSKVNYNQQNDFKLKLKNLEDSLNDGNNDVHNCVINNNIVSTPKLEMYPQIESLDKTEKRNEITSEILVDQKSNALSETTLNENLTKILADALDDDLDLLNIQLDDEIEEPFNEDILNLLEREIVEKEIDTLSANTKYKETKTSKNQTSLNINENNVITKYLKTNLKAKAKIYQTQNRCLLNPTISSLVFKQSNAINVKDLQNPVKGIHEIFFHQQQQKIPAKVNVVENANAKISNKFGQRKSPNKENLENSISSLNIRKIKSEIFTPASNFINMDRGYKTPIKREQMFLKESPKSQEKQEETLIKITPTRLEKIAKKVNLKRTPSTQEKQKKTIKQYTPPEIRQKPQSPRIQEKQENVILKYTKPAIRPKSAEPIDKENLKSKIEQYNNNKTPQTPKKKVLIVKESKSKSPLQCVTRPNEKCLSPTNTVMHTYPKTPLTTPQRLKNVSIKLQRFTPDKLDHDAKNIIKCIKLPKGISLTLVPNSSSTDSTIIETPVKSTYCKQNFSESSFDNNQTKETKIQKPIVVKSTLIKAQNKIMNNLQTESNSSILRQRMASIDIIPSTQGNIKHDSKPSTNKTPHINHLDYKSYAVNRSSRKKEVLQRMRNVKKQILKSIEGSECINKINVMKSPATKRKIKQNVYIENVQILPNIDNDARLPFIFNAFKKPTTATTSVFPKNSADDQKQTKSLERNDSSTNDIKKCINKALKRKASSPLLNENNQAKRQQKSPAKNRNKVVEQISDLEATQLDLSESVVDFLQRDLKANPINVESLLNEDFIEDYCSPSQTPKDAKTEDTTEDDSSVIINDLLEQVDNEKTTKEKVQKRNSTDINVTLSNQNTVEDFNASKDIDLLSKFGLKIIKLPTIEDRISLQERDEMYDKAKKFANIYKNWPRIWTTKNSESHTLKEELDISFKQLLTETKRSFNLDLSIVELKRLANLINIWYTHSFSTKLIEKRKIPESINSYLLMFYFIPKTIKRFYYCEYCEEHFNTEHKYFTHRIIHTGDKFPYTCQKCFAGYKTARHIRNHEPICHLTQKIFKTSEAKPALKDYVRSTSRYKCQECSEKFLSSELLCEHSKIHLKTIYNCAKCELSFSSAMDVQNHMSVCNTATKRMPKQYTPRPKKVIAESK